MVSKNEIVLSDSAWDIVESIVQDCHLESFPGIFELVHLYRQNQDWNDALNSSNGSRAWFIASSRSLGSAPPIDDPSLSVDVESAARAFVRVFSGGACSCGRWLVDLPVAYLDGQAEWSCTSSQEICKETDISQESLIMPPEDATKWHKWRSSASKFMKDPSLLSKKRLRSALAGNDWFEWTSLTWEDVESCPLIIRALEVAWRKGTPFSSHGSKDLAQLVMDHFAERDTSNETSLETIDEWDDVKVDKDGDAAIRNIVKVSWIEHNFQDTLSPSSELAFPFGTAAFNRTPTLADLEHKECV